MHLPVRIKLSVMMFLQFAAAYSTMNWGAIFAPIVAGFFFVTGQLIGSWAAGAVVDRYASATDAGTQHLWQAIWLVPAVMAFVVMVLFMVFFRDPVLRAPQQASAPP